PLSVRTRLHQLPGWPGQAPHPWVHLPNRGFSSHLFLWHAARRRLIDDCPKHTQLLNGIHKLVKVDGLDHIRVDAILVTLDHVTFFARGSEYDHRNHPELFIRLNRLQYLETVHLGQFQVEQHDRRILAAAPLELSAIVEVVERLLAIAGDHDLVAEVI